MTKKMLIDATQSEETRVVILDGNKIEDLDVETSIKKQIKSNIYLAKIIRVEPSLQAAFVDYGGNRHGFLAFNEIHPDYYQIPVADKEKIKEEMLKVSKEEEAIDEEDDEKLVEEGETKTEDKKENDTESKENKEVDEIDTPETVSDVDYDEMVRIKHNYARNYKIQEIIRKGQILLVQVVKEERGNKGAALTTYLSLAGRYCVLMPNNVKGGGISKKISNSKDRQKLKKILNELEIPQGMSVIVRTAGKDRTKTEIKRDYEFLIKSWVKVRDLTVKSTAPALVLEEGNIIKRSLRDNYSKEMEEIIIAGDEGYKNAKEYIKMLSPSHAKKLLQYKEKEPIFYHYQIENQLESIHSPYVQLKSGAYLVINQTEALVAIDVNSGRSTKERSIEETALKANLEAAEEIARQLRLRDLAGLVVIDFIDMDEMKNNHALERRMKEVLKKDRARIQVGKISGFGLMEISRQRRHSSLLESNYHVCPYCRGRGLIRSSESSGIYILRMIEAEAIKGKVEEMSAYVPTDLALHILNKKRDDLKELEQKYEVKVTILADDHLDSFLDYRIEKTKMRQGQSINPQNNEVKKQPLENKVVENVAPAPVVVDSSENKDLQNNLNKKRKKNKRDKRKGDRNNDRNNSNPNFNQNPNTAEIKKAEVVEEVLEKDDDVSVQVDNEANSNQLDEKSIEKKKKRNRNRYKNKKKNRDRDYNKPVNQGEGAMDNTDSSGGQKNEAGEKNTENNRSDSPKQMNNRPNHEMKEHRTEQGSANSSPATNEKTDGSAGNETKGSKKRGWWQKAKEKLVG